MISAETRCTDLEFGNKGVVNAWRRPFVEVLLYFLSLMTKRRAAAVFYVLDEPKESIYILEMTKRSLLNSSARRQT
jgi:hypothetical protein